MLKRQLVLEEGTIFTGEGFGSETEPMGEVTFHTGAILRVIDSTTVSAQPLTGKEVPLL